MMKQRTLLPMNYDTYIFDLYGTLVDIHTDEMLDMVWEKLALFFGYYKALYAPAELRKAYYDLVTEKEAALKKSLSNDPKYSHEASPEIDIVGVFKELFSAKGVECDDDLAIYTGQIFRVLSTDYVKAYPGTAEMLASLKAAGKKIYLLSNAQKIFTEFEMHTIDIFKYFDKVYISSDYQVKKPDKRFFDILLDQQKIDVKTALFVGNDSRTDIGGAMACGLDTFYVNSNISPADDSAPNATYAVEAFEAWGAK